MASDGFITHCYSLAHCCSCDGYCDGCASPANITHPRATEVGDLRYLVAVCMKGLHNGMLVFCHKGIQNSLLSMSTKYGVQTDKRRNIQPKSLLSRRKCAWMYNLHIFFRLTSITLSRVISSVLFNDAVGECVASVIRELMSHYWCNNADRVK
jgi:hypothetical protein